MSNIVIGTRGAIEQPIKYRWSPQRGWITIRTWRGEEAAIRTIMTQLVNGGWEVECSSGPVWEVTGSLSAAADGSSPNDPSNVIDLWELLPNVVEKDLLRADNATINAIAPTQRSILQTSIDNNDKDIPATLTDSNAKILWQFMKDGERSVLVFAPVLRHTQTVSNGYTTKASLANVGSIISPASIGNLAGVPNTVLFTLPNNSTSKANLAYGWFQNYPTIQQVAYNKFQIVQEWQYGLWNTLIYGNAL